MKKSHKVILTFKQRSNSHRLPSFANIGPSIGALKYTSQDIT